MIVNVDRDDTISRKQAWLATWIAVATSNSCKAADLATDWADYCLREFDKRFPDERKEYERLKKKFENND